MRRLLLKFVVAAIFWLAAVAPTFAQFGLVGLVATPDYTAIVAQSPPGLQVALTLPKNHFYQGEIINATLTYSNSGKDSYTARLARGDRSGRLMEIHFFGQDDHHVAVEDPIGWIYMTVVSGGGPGEERELVNGSSAAMTIIANQWLRFDHPGTYTIFVDTTNVHPKPAPGAGYQETQLVSNKVIITIDPLPPDEEKKIIADATRDIDAGYHREDSPGLTAAANEDRAHTRAYAAEPAIAALRYLQTPAARAALRARFDKTPEYMLAGGRFEMAAALLGAPDRPAEAAFILDDVRAGRLKIDSGLIGLYTQLKSYPEFMEYLAWEKRDMKPADFPQWRAVNATWEKSGKVAEKEILAAATQAAAKTGTSNLDLIWTAFQTNPYNDEYRAPVVAHQLDFSHDRQLQLLSMVEMSFCGHMSPPGKNYTPDFLPLVRLYLGPPAYNLDALMILSYARPQEAHDITLADWASPVHHYFDHHGNMGLLAVTLLENPSIKWTAEQKDILDRMRRGGS